MFDKHKIIITCAILSCVAIFAFWHTKQPGTSIAVKELTRSEKDAIIGQALRINLSTPSAIVSDEALLYRAQAISKVRAAKYEEAIEVILSGLRKEHDSFTLQAILAALIGDTSEITEEPLKSKMLQKAKELFDELLMVAERQPKEAFYMFQNEYNFRNALYKEQYENGLACVGHYWASSLWDPYGIKGYYYQGVGAARYAKILLLDGHKADAHEYAQKAIVAWAQYFSYKNDYYNAYVHYALALGILGYHQEMMRALQRSSIMIGKDLDYSEFKEITDFVEQINQKSLASIIN